MGTRRQPNLPGDQYVTVRDLRFHFYDWGGDGPPLLLLHGLASNCHIWDRVAPLLVKGFSVTALDQRSHGDSEGTAEGYDFANTVADVKSFMEVCNIQRPILVGHSWGGNVALHVAVKHPEAVAGLILVDGGLVRPRDEQNRSWEVVERDMAPPDLTHFTIDQLIERSKEHRWKAMWHPAVESVLRASFQVQPDGTIRPRLKRERHMEIVRALWGQNPDSLYPEVRVPVLILPARQGETSQRNTLSHMPKEETVAFVESLLFTSRTIWLEDSIHDVPLQRPELVAKLIVQSANEGFFKIEHDK